ncbi:hypothetical protein B5M47_03155 [candidate division CPR3 bacterium 4484_211]|uniref:Antitoxin n=1 Tax=candidate division CPR3 bacterium 4484_211 TaxID=1968527 RepID=A0A1W9NX78_UNCC3|nr:MAG: hypothetical protein B5M47_03155 [candidate division CPR3 bacterium 4484_211]
MTNGFSLQNTITVTDARSKLGKLVSKVQNQQTYLLTKRGYPKAVLVDVNYWEQVLGKLHKLYQSTFVDPKLIKYTREFSRKEIEQWAKKDKP